MREFKPAGGANEGLFRFERRVEERQGIIETRIETRVMSCLPQEIEVEMLDKWFILKSKDDICLVNFELRYSANPGGVRQRK
jgi:hypothetical protein